MVSWFRRNETKDTVDKLVQRINDALATGALQGATRAAHELRDYVQQLPADKRQAFSPQLGQAIQVIERCHEQGLQRTGVQTAVSNATQMAVLWALGFVAFILVIVFIGAVFSSRSPSQNPPTSPTDMTARARRERHSEQVPFHSGNSTADRLLRDPISCRCVAGQTLLTFGILQRWHRPGRRTHNGLGDDRRRAPSPRRSPIQQNGGMED